uniref:MATA-HMG n=1 Tax=Rhizophagus irregularis TaxID=588596 RepID=A0A1B1ETL4_9GLOM|nr:MATA-HMG [Rhizophagus irregularis]
MSQSTFYVVKRGYMPDTKVPPSPPQRPSNKPIFLNDEEIVFLSTYDFAIKVEVLLANSRGNRRPRRNSGPPRPQNAFILYRRDKAKKHKNEHKGLRSCDISKKIAKMWSEETPEVKVLFEALSRLSEKAHNKKYGNYKYRPMSKKDRNDRERYSPIPDSPSSLSSSSSYGPIFEDNADNNDMILDEFFTFDDSDESCNTASNFSGLSDIWAKKPSDISGTLDGTAINEPNDVTTSYGINSNDMPNFGNLYTPPAGPIQFDDNFLMFAYQMYTFFNSMSANPNPPMRPGAENTAFLGSTFNEPN